MAESVPEKTRVSMLWPEDLKGRVRERVGGRGLTDFTIEAVEAKLGGHDVHKADSKELGEVKDLAQRLADALALGGDYEDRASALRLLELPAWVQTIGWPEQLVDVVRPEDSTPEPVEPEVSQRKAERPVEDVELPAVGDPGTIRSVESDVQGQASDDWVDKVRRKAAEKGVDLSGVDLKTASSIELPKEEAPAEPPVEPIATPIANPNVCPECGTELVGGECWECFT